MSDSPAFGFGNFVPGFDFLQTLVQSAAKSAAPRPGAGSGMPDWSSWIAPTMKVEDLDKRINELKTVQFWLEQNARALAATIQALEVQKMSLATLRSMNVQVGDLAAAFGLHAGAPASAPAPSASGPYDDMYTARPAAESAAPAAPAQEAAAPPAAAPAAAPGVVDPLQWWNALTGQFQQIAATAMQDAARHAKDMPMAQMADATRQAFDAAGRMAADAMKDATEGRSGKAPTPPPAKKPAAPRAATKTAAKSARPAASKGWAAAAAPRAAAAPPAPQAPAKRPRTSTAAAAPASPTGRGRSR